MIDGERITVSEMGETLCTAKFEERPEWFDTPLSGGQPAWVGVIGMTPDLIAVVQNDLCYNQASGKACRYCVCCMQKSSNRRQLCG